MQPCFLPRCGSQTQQRADSAVSGNSHMPSSVERRAPALLSCRIGASRGAQCHRVFISYTISHTTLFSTLPLPEALEKSTASQPPATHPNMGRAWRTSRLAGLPSVVCCTQRASSFHSRLTTPLQSDSTCTQGLLATWLTALSFFNIPPALDGSWELYLAGGPSARVQSLKKRTEEIMQLLHIPQEPVHQARASFIAACLKVEGCGCGFRDGPLAP